ncbi:MAG: DUF2336 domain-containing protein [Caulobacteraceae bacterium]
MSLDAARTEQLLALAGSGSSVDRGQLLLAVVDACQGADATVPRLRALLNDVFMSLIGDAERDIRLRLAEKIAGEPWAPHALILTLVNDEIEIARPVIAQSVVLLDDDLIQLLSHATIDHQIEVARRPALSAAVVRAVIDQGEADVLAALAANAQAEISLAAMTRLVRFSKRMAALRAPLARHPGLTSDLAGLLYGWVGESLRAGLLQRYSVAGSVLEGALAQTVQEVHAGSGWDASDPDGRSERALTEQRMVQKLQAAGQLRAGLLVRALHEGKLTLFKTGLAALGGLPFSDITAAMDSDRPDQLGAICTEVGIDRSVFPTVLRLVRRLNGERPGPGAAIFSPRSDQSSGPRRYVGV